MNRKPLHLDINPQLECAETLASRFYTDPAKLVPARDAQVLDAPS